MSLLAPCHECLVVDQLERHDAMCSYARKLGLPRLAEGEDPILPDDEPDPPTVPLDSETPALDRAVEVANLRADGSSTRTQRADWQADPPLPEPLALCVGCGLLHQRYDEPHRPIGALRIYESCEWRLRYPEREAWQVIDELELAIKQRAEKEEANAGSVE